MQTTVGNLPAQQDPLLTRIAAALRERYRFDRAVGRGGMATVFLAEDVKHARRVAVKVLNPDIASAIGPERFRREIEIAARLSHPGILPLHDSGEADGLLYFTMPFVEGESLRSRLSRDGTLPVPEALALGRQLADALGYAHETGVLHRDIKPENILLLRGHALIADFGVARAPYGEGQALTRTGMAVGTPAYMSPEQATGDPTVDARSDVYSLGCVLYEMLAGSPPFVGSSAQATIALRFSRSAEPLRRVRPDVPARVESTIMRCLALESRHRFATAGDLLRALDEDPSAGGTAGGDLSVLVLPFVNSSIDPENEYFADGLTEELIADLSHMPALRVISRTSAMRLKGTSKDVPTIGRDLNVRYVLEGSVRKAHSNLRITAQLVDAVTDTPLWADKFSGTVDDVFSIQERVSRAIADALRLRLAPEVEHRLRDHAIPDVRAWECYLRARQELNRYTTEGIDGALALLREGTAASGDNALLIGMTGYAHLLRLKQHLGVFDAAELEALAEACARRAEELDPRSAFPRFLHGMLAYERGDMQNAVRAFEAALDRDPNHVESLFWISICLLYVGQTNQGKVHARRLLRVDPLTALNHALGPVFDAFEGRYEEAVRATAIAYAKEPHHPDVIWTHAYLLAVAGDIDEARTVADRLETVAPDWVYSRQLLSLLDAHQGNVARAHARLTEDVAREAERDQHLSLHLAESYAAVNLLDQALASFENAVRRGFIHYPFFAQHDPFLAPLREDMAFKAMLERVRDAWSRFEVRVNGHMGPPAV